jgi:hypothetical protein
MWISEVPGLVKHASTPPATSVPTKLSAPFIPFRPGNTRQAMGDETGRSDRAEGDRPGYLQAFDDDGYDSRIASFK